MNKIQFRRAVISATLLTTAAFANANTLQITDADTANNTDDVSASMISRVIANAFATTATGGITISNSSAKQIKNAPYRAEVVNEDVQTLNDGNQIIKRHTQQSFRDSAGRTRTELNDADGNIRSVSIFDAVEKTTYQLNPKLKTATKMSIDPNFQKRIDEIREKANSGSQDNQSSVLNRSAGKQIIIMRAERSAGESKEIAAEDVKISRLSAPIENSGEIKVSVFNAGTSVSGGQATSPNISVENLAVMGGLSTSFSDRAWAAKATTRTLGTKEFDGIRAEGKLRAYTIPVGEVGNKNPITVSTETWVSPELQITLYSKHSDPRSGDKIYRLQNIKRSEQALNLFSVPEGYQLKETPMMKFDLKTK